MKNQHVYEMYSIEGWPCHFYTMAAVDKYNARIEKYCNKLPDGAQDLSRVQRLKLKVYILYLSLYDSIQASKERNKQD
jgi:hypothetical protein